MNRLLIVACSQRKSPLDGRLPAIDRYDGPVFRVLRKYLREQSADDSLVVLILSAKYGLIPADHEIPDYDCRLSRVSATRLRPQVLTVAGGILLSCDWEKVGICAGSDYRIALDGLRELVPPDVAFRLIEGGLGQRLAVLKSWLNETSSEEANSTCRRRAQHVATD